MKNAFFSFYFDDDFWRVQQIRNIGKIGNIKNEEPLKPNEWESIKRTGDLAIKNWIHKQINKCDVFIVLIGENTYKRPWVRYEIEYANSIGKPIYGIYIHNLKDNFKNVSNKGQNPFNYTSAHLSLLNFIDPKADDAYNQIKNFLENI